jgi:cytochrome c5
MNKKKIIILFSAISVLIIACHKKAVPTFTTRSIDINETVNSNNTTPDIESGKTTFSARCNRCHDLPDPAKYNAQRWDGILSVMTFRARLTKEETDNLTAYIKANCAK